MNRRSFLSRLPAMAAAPALVPEVVNMKPDDHRERDDIATGLDDFAARYQRGELTPAEQDRLDEAVASVDKMAEELRDAFLAMG